MGSLLRRALHILRVRPWWHFGGGAQLWARDAGSTVAPSAPSEWGFPPMEGTGVFLSYIVRGSDQQFTERKLLDIAVDAADTTLPVYTAYYPTLPFRVEVRCGPAREVMLAVGQEQDCGYLTVLRGQEGTAPQAWLPPGVSPMRLVARHGWTPLNALIGDSTLRL